jgi:PAS domain S-box-containing protein
MVDAHGDYSRLAEVVSKLGLHEHLCVIYDTQEEQFAAALPYLKTGLERGEKCLYILGENTAAAVLGALGKSGTDVDRYLRDGALTIAHKEEIYREQGRFEPDWMIGFLTEATTEAGLARFSRVRTFLAEMTWALGKSNGTAKLIEFESKLNRFYRDHDARGICQYNRRLFSPELLLDVIRTHPIVVYGGMVSKNPYYVPPDEFLKPRQADRELERLLDNIQEWERTTQALRQSEDHWRLVIDTIPTMAWSVRPDGIVDFLNQRWRDYSGLSLEQYVKDPTGPIHPEDVSRVIEKWLVDKAVGEPCEDEMRLRRADGEYRWFLVRTVPLRDERGNIVKWYGSSIDIEDRKRAEGDLRKQKEMLQKIFDNAPSMIALRGTDGKMTFANREFERTLGWTSEEVLWHDLDLPELRVRARDGRVIETSWGKVHLSDGADIYIGRDITERKRVEEIQAAQTVQAELRAEVSTAFARETELEGILQKCTEAMVRHLDAAFARIWTLKKNDNMLELRASAGMYTHLDGAHGRLLVGTLEIGRIAQERKPLLTNEVLDDPLISDRAWAKREGMVALAGYPLVVEGRVVGVMAMFARRALTPGTLEMLASVADTIAQGIERKQAEVELQHSFAQLRALAGRLQRVREEERTRVAREIHDELGQALTAIKIDLSLLRDDLSRDQDPRFERILKEVDETIGLVRKISTELRPSLLDAVGLVAAIEWAAGEFESRHRTTCRLNLPRDEMVIDPERATALFRIFQETLTNVARHAEATEVNVRLAREDAMLILEIQDNGIGISEEQLSAGGSLGILGMRERALLLGGECIISGERHRGTLVRVGVPLSAVRDGDRAE